MYGAGYGSTFYAGGFPPGPLSTALYIAIDGIDRTANYRERSFRLSLRLAGRSTARFTLVDKTNALSISEGQSVIIRLNASTILGGTVYEVSETFPSMDTACDFKFVDIKAVDYSEIADRKILNAEYNSQAAGTTISDIIDDKLAIHGITTDEVEDGPTLEPIKFQMSTVSAAFDKIAQIAGYLWFIDSSKRMRFFSSSGWSTAWQISDGLRRYSQLTKTKSLQNYRNVQYVRGGKDIAAARSRTFVGDGSTTTWTVDAPIAEEPTITVGGAGQSVGIRGVDDESAALGNDFFWRKGESGVSQNTSAAPVANGTSVVVTYKPLFGLLTVDTDSAGVNERKGIDGGDGRYEAAIYDGEIEDASLASDYASALLRKYASVATQIKVSTFTLGIVPGRLQNVNLTKESIFGNFLILEATYKDQGQEIYQVDYRAVDTEDIGGWRDYYKALKDSQRQWALGGQDVILEAGEVEENVYVADTHTEKKYFDLDSWKTDPFSFVQATDGQIGAEYEYGGVTYRVGPEIGTPEYPGAYALLARFEYPELNATASN